MKPENSDIHTSQPPRDRRRVGDIMTGSVTAARGVMTLQEVAAMMRDGDMGALPVVDGAGKLVGIVTDRDIVVRAAAEGRDLNLAKVYETMTTELFTVRADDFVFQAIRLMGDKQVRRLPVVDDAGTLLGILSMADIALESEDEREIAEALEDISSGAAFWNKG